MSSGEHVAADSPVLLQETQTATAVVAARLPQPAMLNRPAAIHWIQQRPISDGKTTCGLRNGTCAECGVQSTFKTPAGWSSMASRGCSSWLLTWCTACRAASNHKLLKITIIINRCLRLVLCSEGPGANYSLQDKRPSFASLLQTVDAMCKSRQQPHAADCQRS